MAVFAIVLPTFDVASLFAIKNPFFGVKFIWEVQVKVREILFPLVQERSGE